MKRVGICVGILLSGTWSSTASSAIVGVSDDPGVETSVIERPAGPATVAAWTLNRIVPLDQGRVAERRVRGAEAATLRRSVDYVFSDKTSAERRRIYKRALNLAATAPPFINAYDRDVSALIEIVVGAIERAAEARRGLGTTTAREEVRLALAALGWCYRVLSVTPGDGGEIKRSKREILYAAVGASTVGSTAAFVAQTILPTSNAAFLVTALYCGAQLTADMVLAIDFSLDPVYADAWARSFTFVDARATKRTIAQREVKFWYDLEKRLSQRAEWRDFVKSRAQHPGTKSIARDVRAYLQSLAGAKSLNAVCDDLLRGSAFPSPYY